MVVRDSLHGRRDKDWSRKNVEIVTHSFVRLSVDFNCALFALSTFHPRNAFSIDSFELFGTLSACYRAQGVRADRPCEEALSFHEEETT